MRQRFLSAGLAMLALSPVAQAQQGSPLVLSASEPLEMMLLRTSASSRCGEKCIVRGMPYSAERVTESVRMLADGNRIVERSTEKLYRDSDGRTRVESVWEGKSLVQIQDPIKGMSFRLYPETKTGYRMAIAAPAPAASPSGVTATATTPAAAKVAEQLEPALAARLAELRSQSVVRKLGTREIGGVNVEGTQITRTLPAGSSGNVQPIVSTSETWTSRELRLDVQVTSSDPRFGDRTTRLENFSRLEPPAALFAAPADYTVQEIVRR